MIQQLIKQPFKLKEFKEHGKKFVDKGYGFSILYIMEKDNDLYLMYCGNCRNQKMYAVIKDWKQYTFLEVINTTDGNRLLTDGFLSFYHKIGRLGYTDNIFKEL